METLEQKLITMRSEDGPTAPPDAKPPEKPGTPPACMTCEGKKRLLHKLRVCTFAVTEAREYMDTHPDDQAAIAYYKKHKASLDALQKEWDDCSGEVFDGGRWALADTPWPWQSRL